MADIVERLKFDAARSEMFSKGVATNISEAISEIERLRAAGRAIIEANDEFRATLPDDWESDPVNDACQAARDLFGNEQNKAT